MTRTLQELDHHLRSFKRPTDYRDPDTADAVELALALREKLTEIAGQIWRAALYAVRDAGRKPITIPYLRSKMDPLMPERFEIPPSNDRIRALKLLARCNLLSGADLDAFGHRHTGLSRAVPHGERGLESDADYREFIKDHIMNRYRDIDLDKEGDIAVLRGIDPELKKQIAELVHAKWPEIERYRSEAHHAYAPVLAGYCPAKTVHAALLAKNPDIRESEIEVTEGPEPAHFVIACELRHTAQLQNTVWECLPAGVRVDFIQRIGTIDSAAPEEVQPEKCEAHHNERNR